MKQLITALLQANQEHAAAFWDASAPAGSKKQHTADAALKAIQQFKENPLAALERGVAKTIIEFSEASPAVMISFSEKVVPWIGKGKMDERRSVLLAAYVAGNTESQLRRGKKQDDPFAGVSQAIATYRQLQAADPSFRLEELETLIKLEQEGRLQEYLSAK